MNDWRQDGGYGAGQYPPREKVWYDRIFDVTGVVLAGGMSRRMGFDKAMLNFQGNTMLTRVTRKMRAIFDRVLIAGGDPKRYPDAPAQVVRDLLDGQGALIGVHAGLKAAYTKRIFIIGCDAPFPKLSLVRYLTEVEPEADWVVPQTATGVEPLFAVYSHRCVEPLEELFRQGERRLTQLADMVHTVYIPEEEVREFDPDLRSFTNINTPEDLEKVLYQRRRF